MAGLFRSHCCGQGSTRNVRLWQAQCREEVPSEPSRTHPERDQGQHRQPRPSLRGWESVKALPRCCSAHRRRHRDPEEARTSQCLPPLGKERFAVSSSNPTSLAKTLSLDSHHQRRNARLRVGDRRVCLSRAPSFQPF